MIDHVEINVANLANSRKFWGWLLTELGYRPFQDWGAGFSMIYEKTYIVFVQTKDDHRPAGFHRQRIGLNHLAFRTSSTRFTAIAAELLTRKVDVLYPQRSPFAGGPNHKAIYFEDPDRIKVEVICDS